MRGALIRAFAFGVMLALLRIAPASAAPTGSYLEFDGVDDRVTVADSASLDITGAITIEAWVRPDAISNTKDQNRIVSKSADLELTISTGDTGCGFGTNGHVQWRSTIAGSNNRICGGALVRGTWQHLAATYDGAQVALFVNGVRVASAARSGPLAANSSALALGDHPTTSRPYDGGLDEVRIWNRALAPSEIQAQMNVELTGSEAGLVALYRLNESAGQVAADGALNGNHGRLGASAGAELDDPQWATSGPPVNLPPVVSAGPDRTITFPTSTTALNGAVSDDGLPGAPLLAEWTQLSGPAAVVFANPRAIDTTATFSVAGNYELRLSADDAEYLSSDAVVVTVRDELPSPLQVWPTQGWTTATPAQMGMSASKLDDARSYALTGGGSGFITRGGKLVLSWGSTTNLYDVKSVTKSIGSALLGLAVKDRRLALANLAQQHLSSVGIPPTSNADTGWLDEITIGQLATHTAGFDKPGGFVSLLYRPGTAWAYSDGGANWLADVLTVKFGTDLYSVLLKRVMPPLGINTSALTWRANADRTTTINGITRRELGAGIHISVDAMARIGYLFLRAGKWSSQEIVQSSFVAAVRSTVAANLNLPVRNDTLSRFANAPRHYGILWWNNADGSMPGVPLDAYWAWGLGDHLIVVIPSLDIVATRAGAAWSTSHSPSIYGALAPFITPIAQSVVQP